MGDFFLGWRRKVGILTLLMACVFAGGWVRSLIVADFVRLPFNTEPGAETVSAISTNSGVVDLYWFSKPIEIPGPAVAIATSTQPIESTFSLSTADDLFKDRSTGIFAEEASDKLPTTLVPMINRPMSQLVPTLSFSLWTIVIPLTLLSALLLLFKPRKSTSKKIPESIPAEGT